MRFDIKAEALADLENIYAYGLSEHGIERAENYLARLRAQFDRLIEFPKLGPQAVGLRQNLRFWKFEQHHIYYRATATSVTIVRILHHAMNAAARLTGG